MGIQRARRLDTAFRELDTERERRDDGAATWTTDSLTDTVRLAFHTMFSGTSVRLALPQRTQAHDTLRGIAVSVFDFGSGEDEPARRVTAVRVPCHIQ
jgi:hypothetical protein